MNACIYFTPEAYSVDHARLMGRHVAGESFLKGFLSYSHADQFWIFAEDDKAKAVFADKALALQKNQPVNLVRSDNLAALAQPGVLSLPGPGLATHAFQRAQFGRAKWSLCGITHTTSSANAMDALAGLLTAPVYPWDALICTSNAVRDNVCRVLGAQKDYLIERFSIQKLELPMLPVIPLGIDPDGFDFSGEEKQLARSELGFQQSDMVFLYVGRLSFHAKAHPLAMYQALQIAAEKTQKNIVLIECGWFANAKIEEAFKQAASLCCPSVKVVSIDGRNEVLRRAAWAAADVFCSLSDNIQETFGITPIEAMAAGLPVVVSDWDGYKDTVRDGIDGFRIPTLIPPEGSGDDLAIRHALEVDSYDRYCGNVCAMVAVDIASTAQAFEYLINNPALVKQMGHAGKKRAQQVYDWRVIIPQYEALWQELSDIRTSQVQDLKPNQHPWPARMDPFYAFASYPTAEVSGDTCFSLVIPDVAYTNNRFVSLMGLAMVSYPSSLMCGYQDFKKIIDVLGGGAASARDISTHLGGEQGRVYRSLVWLVKLGVIRCL